MARHKVSTGHKQQEPGPQFAVDTKKVSECVRTSTRQGRRQRGCCEGRGTRDRLTLRATHFMPNANDPCEINRCPAPHSHL